MKKRGFVLMQFLVYFTIMSIILLSSTLLIASSLNLYKKISNDALLREIASTAEDRIMYSMKNISGIYAVKGLQDIPDNDGFFKVCEIGFHEFSESDLVLKTKGLLIYNSENNPTHPSKALYLGNYSFSNPLLANKYQIAYYVDSLMMKLEKHELSIKISYRLDNSSRVDILRIPLPEEKVIIRKEH